jgi:hypothetical protein
MDRKEIIAALTALAGELERRGTSAEMYVVGGAAIALAFDERRATHDIDSVFEPKNVVYEAAATVADQLGLSGGWLNRPQRWRIRIGPRRCSSMRAFGWVLSRFQTRPRFAGLRGLLDDLAARGFSRSSWR